MGFYLRHRYAHLISVPVSSSTRLHVFGALTNLSCASSTQEGRCFLEHSHAILSSSHRGSDSEDCQRYRVCYCLES